MSDAADTANLQTHRGRMTVKRAAMVMNVSERSVYMAIKVSRRRPDLAAQVRAGTMKLNEAYRLVTNWSPPTKVEQLVQAYRRLHKNDQAQFRQLIAQIDDGSAP